MRDKDHLVQLPWVCSQTMLVIRVAGSASDRVPCSMKLRKSVKMKGPHILISVHLQDQMCNSKEEKSIKNQAKYGKRLECSIRSTERIEKEDRKKEAVAAVGGH